MSEMIYLFEAAFVGAAVIVATNLDNVLLSINMAQAGGIKRVSVTFLFIQLLVITLALGLSQGLEGVPSHWVGYLGFLPIALGIRELLKKKNGDSVAPPAGSAQSAIVLASNSGDSLAVLVVTFSDNAEEFDPLMAVGAGVAAVLLTTVLILLSHWSILKRYLAPIASKIQPWLMILIGLLVLWDTPFDVQ